MGASNLGNMGSDLDDRRAERDARMNPPEHAPMQGGDLDSFFDDDSTDSLGGGLSLGLDTPATPSAGGFDMGQNTQMLMQGQQNQYGMQGQGYANKQQAKDDMEAKFYDFLTKLGRTGIDFVKDFISSFKLLNPKFWTKWGSNSFVSGLVFCLIGVVTAILGLSIALDIIIAGVLSSMAGVLVLMLNLEKAKCYDSPYNEDTQPVQVPMADEWEINETDGVEEEFDDPFEEEFFEEDDPFEDIDEDDSSGIDPFASGSDVFDPFSSNKSESSVSIEDSVTQLQTFDKGVVTREYLFEVFTRVLPSKNSDFAKVTEIDPDSDTFITWESCLRDAAEVHGAKESSLPELIKLEETMFTIKMTCTRPAGFKLENVAEEISKLYAHSGGNYKAGVFATSLAVGKTCIITVFTNEGGLVTLKDMYSSCRGYMLDTGNHMPVVLGIDEGGKCITYDFKNTESVLITGMTRSGKSWCVQSMLTQMCALVPPSELNLYICDPKDGISDFNSFTLPHVKKFVSGDGNILQTLRSVVKDLAPKRKTIIGNAKCVNIWDFKAKYPSVHFPVIYIVIDEVVTLAERMNKEDKSEFQGLLVELISQLPACGIRAFLVPHVVKNDIIAKTATDLISSRFSVRGDAAHIESSTGTKPKDFPYKLSNKGDMAVRIPDLSPDTLFIHSPAITPSNEGNSQLFDYLRQVWLKIEPDEFEDSVCKNIDGVKEIESKVNNLDLNNVDDIDIFNNTTKVKEKPKNKGLGLFSRRSEKEKVKEVVRNSVDLDDIDDIDIFDNSSIIEERAKDKGGQEDDYFSL